MNTRPRAFEACPETGSPVGMASLPFEHIEGHRDAFVVPFRRGVRTGPRFHAGAFDAAGAPLCNTEMRTIHRASLATKEVRDAALADAGTLHGEWLFCGILSAQFGHIITRSLGMLWAIEHVPKSVKLLFVSMMYDSGEHRFLETLLATLGIENDYKILRRPAHVETLYTAPDLFSEVIWCAAPQVYVDWIKGRMPTPGASEFGRKIYITRDRLSGTAGRHLCEDILEDNLARAGFDIVAPETLTLAQQLAMYRHADTVIAADGSALHILPFSIRDTASVYVLQRRTEFPPLIANHLSSFTNAAIHRIDAIDDVIWPQDRADNTALVALDFKKLQDLFIGHGVLRATEAWRCPDQKDFDASRALGRPKHQGFMTDSERPQFLRDLRRSKLEKKAMKDVADALPIPVIDGLRYFRVLNRLHEKLQPDWYLEVGTFTGKSLSLAKCNTIAVDPKFQISFPVVNATGRKMHFFQQTSDDFFAEGFVKQNKIKIDFAFLDGMHLFEFLLRDFIEAEKLMSPDGVIALHDCCPTTDYMAEREFHDGQWTGDVWKTLLILQQYRPDLQIDVLSAAPTGLVLIRNLNPRSTVLSKKYDALVKEFMDEELSDFDGGIGGYFQNFNLVDPLEFLDTL
ncbi:MAG: glycosyltransferase 61 family protein [Marivita sp.]|uniref:glycosyltransferase 61 family protein n=1 Tax=Marivita sp. TaxID=2003365 RepID=UPI003EFAF92F